MEENNLIGCGIFFLKMWYIFPQIKGLGMSETSRYYGIDGEEEAKAYLDNEILGSRLREITSELLKLNIDNPVDIFGTIDAMKLKSSMTLFDYVSEDKIFSHTLWQMSTECIVVFPEGVGVLPWMLCGTKEIGEATAKKMQDYRLVIWGLHGVYASGKDMDETFGLIETVEKAATIYNLIGSRKIINTITNDNLKEIANYFKVNYRKEFLD